jgi:hypothetical protein
MTQAAFGRRPWRRRARQRARRPHSVTVLHLLSCRDLRLEWCGSLRDVHLRSRSLRHVSFAGCAGVRSLELACPSLSTLNLDECSDLSRCAPVVVCASHHSCQAIKLRKIRAH